MRESLPSTSKQTHQGEGEKNGYDEEYRDEEGAADEATKTSRPASLGFVTGMSAYTTFPPTRFEKMCTPVSKGADLVDISMPADS